jgi:hypothetical protein
MMNAALPLTALALLAINSRKKAPKQSAPTRSASDSDAVRAAREAAKQEATPPFVGPPRPIGPPRPPRPSRSPAVATKPGVQRDVSAASPSRQVPSPPAGYDRIKAANAAGDIARHIAIKGHNYARKALRAWQTVAGVVADGIYGPATREALVYYVGGQAPKALYAGTATPYPWGA